ncbi:hypothetical protein LDENG_00002640 [Lucifuga dentata]|nr:hypothetical protein LDENG_00002640 [Lucifuga dentata]
MVIHAFISSCSDYCSSLFTCLSKTSLNRLQTVQNAAARLLTKARRSHITPILSPLQTLYRQTPPPAHSGQKLLVVPRTHLKTHGDRAFQAVAPKLWNALPSSVHYVDSEAVFRRQLKTFLFRQAFR